MFELEKTEEVQKLIYITRSDSGISGPELVKAHIRLGEIMGSCIGEEEMNPQDTTVVAILRGGIFFALGIYLSMGCRFMTYDPKNQKFIRPETKHVLLVDSVINTGSTIKKILQPDMKVACCVINEKAIQIFSPQLYTVRTSENSFVGSDVKKQRGTKEPDTTMRLFNEL